MAVSGCQTTLHTTPVSSDYTSQAQTRVLTYEDNHGKQILVNYDTIGNTASLFWKGERVVLERTPSASGEKYSNESLIFWTKSDSALLTKNGTNLFKGALIDNWI